MSKKYTKDSICPGGNHLIVAERGDHPALSRYGHGNICSEDGTREALYGDFITTLKSIDDYTAIGKAEGFIECEDGSEEVAAWQHVYDKGLYKSLQGFFGRSVANLIENGVIVPAHA